MSEDKKDDKVEAKKTTAEKTESKTKKAAAKKSEAATSEKTEEAPKAKKEEKKEDAKKETAKSTKKAAPKAEKEEKKEEKAPKAEAKKDDKPAEEKKRKRTAAKKVDVDAEADASKDATEESPKAEEQAEATEAKKEKPSYAPEPIESYDLDEVKPDADFDWDAVGDTEDIYKKEERAEMEEVYDKTLTSISDHEVLDGVVTSLNKKEVVVNIGYKSDGVISTNEFRYNPDLSKGDTVEVYVEKQEDKNGQLILSHKKARTMRAWENVNKALENDEIVTGYIKCRTKGGLIADVFGIEAFLPGSQIDVKPIRDYDVYVGKEMEFKVVKINAEFKNVVVSHKALIEAELEEQKVEIMSKLEKGQVLEGTVKNITSYGVFIDLGGVDGLIHITDLSWGRINHPEEIVSLDEKIKVVILDFDEGKKRIALGLKQLSAHPWDSLDENLKVGDKVKGKVVVLADYGAFVEIAPGVEGLIHVSEMSWSQHLRTAQDFFNVGDEVEAVIMTLDREERKMSLSTRQLSEDPWDTIEKKYPVDSKVKGKATNLSNFGVFVELEEGIDGLIHISDLSWSKKINHPSEFTKVGEEIEAVVLEIDKENRRLSLGHKQLEENPWDVFSSVFTEGSVHQGTLLNLSDKGGIVALPYGLEGFAPGRHLAKEDGSKVKPEESTDFKVLEFNKDAKKIIVSHARTWESESAAGGAGDTRSSGGGSKRKKGSGASRKAMKNISDKLEKTTLGDLDTLSDLKDSMEESEKKGKK